MAKAKKSTKQKLDTLSLANGQIEDPDITKLKQIEEAIGLRHRNPFGTEDFQIFKQSLDSMTTTDLEALAHKVGLFSSGSKDILKTKLLKEFKLITKGNSGISIQRPCIVLDPTNPKHAEMLVILNQRY
jgi:hypothetical protein